MNKKETKGTTEEHIYLITVILAVFFIGSKYSLLTIVTLLLLFIVLVFKYMRKLKVPVIVLILSVYLCLILFQIITSPSKYFDFHIASKEMQRIIIYILIVLIVNNTEVKEKRFINIWNSYMKINKEKFLRQMNYLKDNKYIALNFDDFSNGTHFEEAKIVLITFDDGWLSNYEIVYPIMKKLNLKFNIFLEVGAIGVKENYLTWDMVNEMKESNLVGFGTHTFTHIDARTIDESNYYREIIMANKVMKEKTNLIARDFCFPYGHYNKKTVSYIEKKGVYDRLYTSDGISEIIRNNLRLYGRVGIENEDSMLDFINKLEGKYNNYFATISKIRKFVRGEK